MAITDVRTQGEKAPPARSKAYEMLRDFYRAKNIYDHAMKVAHAPWWLRLGHRLLVGWRCPACMAYRRGEHEGWGFYAK